MHRVPVWVASLFVLASACDTAAEEHLAEADPAIEVVEPAPQLTCVDIDALGGVLHGDGGGLAKVMTEVVFSPQLGDDTHNARVAKLISQARHSIDVAMYSFSNARVRSALAEAAARGVEIRFVLDTASEDRKLEGDALLASRSGELEQAGIDVRWVNKTMHHKFMIVDGPRDDLDRATSAVVATGSANWSDSAASRYDENTLFLQGHPEIALRLQDEFNLMWNHSRRFEAVPELDRARSAVEITPEDMRDANDAHVWFTSDNLELLDDTTFTRTDRAVVGRQLISAIESADCSIWIASGHLRHRGIAEALMAKALTRPELDIRVYLDAQEFISPSAYRRQLRALDECLAEASTDSQTRNCLNKGFLFGFEVEQHGVQVRYKWYSYRWAYPYAKQMHHKYMIVDGDELWTGSYNLSATAEHHTFENMVHLSGARYQALIDRYEANFLEIWDTGRDEDLLADLRSEIETAALIPLVFEPMALEREEIEGLAELIRDNCEQVDSSAFRRHPEWHRFCPR